MTLGKTAQTILMLTLCAVVSLAGWYFLMNNNPRLSINTDRTAVIKEIRNLNRLETASFTIEKIIDGGTTEKGPVSQLLFGDRILLIAHGEVIAGFDLSQISEKDIQIQGTSLSITLPKPQILTTVLDNTQTRVYDRRRGILNMGEDNLESEVRKAAESSIREAACKGNILTQASDNGKKQLTALFMALGFSSVSINVANATCK